MQERDTVWVWLADKERPAVVLDVRPELVRVAYGTSETHEWPMVVVDPSTRQGRAFPLREITHFYGANTSWGVAGRSTSRQRTVRVGAVVRDPQAGRELRRHDDRVAVQRPGRWHTGDTRSVPAPRVRGKTLWSRLVVGWSWLRSRHQTSRSVRARTARRR